jgi:hypothetical protein
MKANQSLLLPVLAISLLLCAGNSLGEEKAAERKLLQSPGGYRAEFVPLEGEGEGKILILKGKLLVAEIPNSKPVSFSPKADILLLAEHAPDDDLQHFLLDLGKGEIKKEGNRLDYVFGGRYVKEARWSDDGKMITLLYYEGLASQEEKKFSVEKLLKR